MGLSRIFWFGFLCCFLVLFFSSMGSLGVYFLGFTGFKSGVYFVMFVLHGSQDISVLKMRLHTCLMKQSSQVIRTCAEKPYPRLFRKS